MPSGHACSGERRAVRGDAWAAAAAAAGGLEPLARRRARALELHPWHGPARVSGFELYPWHGPALVSGRGLAPAGCAACCGGCAKTRCRCAAGRARAPPRSRGRRRAHDAPAV
eukprot:5263866-Prymnesium_polylepis.1